MRGVLNLIDFMLVFLPWFGYLGHVYPASRDVIDKSFGGGWTFIFVVIRASRNLCKNGDHDHNFKFLESALTCRLSLFLGSDRFVTCVCSVCPLLPASTADTSVQKNTKENALREAREKSVKLVAQDKGWLMEKMGDYYQSIFPSPETPVPQPCT